MIHWKGLQGVEFNQETIAGINVEVVTPDVDANEKIIIYFHGGAFMFCSPSTHRSITGRLARNCKCKVIAPHYPLGNREAAVNYCRKAIEAVLGSAYLSSGDASFLCGQLVSISSAYEGRIGRGQLHYLTLRTNEVDTDVHPTLHDELLFHWYLSHVCPKWCIPVGRRNATFFFRALRAASMNHSIQILLRNA